MASKVWKEKFELVTECNKILEDKNLMVKDVPALSDIASVLAAKMSDVNVNVVSACAGMITLLAEKVEDKAFGKYKGVLMPAILARLKEKKTVDALGRALDAIFQTVSRPSQYDATDGHEDSNSRIDSLLGLVFRNHGGLYYGFTRQESGCSTRDITIPRSLAKNHETGADQIRSGRDRACHCRTARRFS